MTPPKKPEWIHIADTDNAVSIRKVSKTLPVIALGSALMIVGAGVVFAQTNSERTAVAVESVISTTPVVASKTLAHNVPTSATTALRIQNVATDKPITPVVAVSQVTVPKAPGLQMPTGGGDDDDDDDDDDRSHRGDDDDEDEEDEDDD